VAQLAAFDTITDSGAAPDSQITLFLRGAGGSINLLTRVAGAHSVYVADSGLTGPVAVDGTNNGDFMVASTNLNVLRGNGGDDTFQVDYAGSGIVNGGTGTDTVQSNDLGSFSLSHVEILDTHGFNQVYATAAQLSAFDTVTDSGAAPDSQITVILRDGPGSVDFSTSVAGAHSVQLFAGALSAGAKITGSSNSDALNGSNFDDILSGAGGNDTMAGSGGSDTFVFGEALVAGNVATIVDFAPGSDSIALSLSIFAAAGPAGPLNANAFFAGSAAHDADDRIIYNAVNGNLMFDADGTGSQTAQTFAVLSPSLAVTAADFKLV
jgi:Ca2+-binding RTX toxin-like protein